MMTTRCPQCGAAFRVAADQLRVRNGLVRCGNCRAVFDGYDCLIDESGPREPLRRLPPAVLRNRADMRRGGDEPYADEPYADEPGVGEPGVGEPGAGEPGADRLAPDEPGAMPSLRAEPAFEPHGPFLPEAPAWTVQGEARTRQIDALDSGRAPPPFMDEEHLRRARHGRVLWALASLLGLAALLLQGAVVYRTQLALAAPALRPALERLCEPLDCRVGYARRIERIAIMSSSLQRQAGSGSEGLVLHVVLRNRYDQPQEWPTLMLSLTDLSDTVVARRALRPADYLSPARAAGPLAAGEEVSLAIPVDPGKLGVNGYQLDKFFP
ncbi:DUF3426 domain-containing protein [Orrella sp. JC864]|uniref:DUF3426 domain-containing protein n=1 Tax=Orrella sp. JC864 TaxID=3120298 RepID=UPI00300B2A47